MLTVLGGGVVHSDSLKITVVDVTEFIIGFSGFVYGQIIWVLWLGKRIICVLWLGEIALETHEGV